MSYINLTERQTTFLNAVLSGKYRQLLYGGAVGGGKSVLVTVLVSLLCKIYPGSRWAIIRKDLPTLKRNFIPTFEKFTPRGFFSKINRTEWTCKAANGSEVLFFAATEDRDPEFQRLRGLELSGAILEEANEMSSAFVDVLVTRVGRWSPPEGVVKPLPLIIGTCNPNQAWPKRKFYVPWRKGTLKPPYYYLPAMVTDNPFLDDEYIENLETLKEASPNMYEMMVLGNWDIADDPDQLIPWEHANNAFLSPAQNQGVRRLGVDVARFGDDDSVLAFRQGMHLYKLLSFSGIDLDRTAAHVMKAFREDHIAPNNTRVDTVGVGAGVAVLLYQERYKIQEFVAGTKPLHKTKFYTFKDLRSEAWWTLREGLRKGEISFDPTLEDKDRIIEDLIAPKYTISNDKVITVEPKDKIKLRLGRSTDYGDAIVMAFAETGANTRWLYEITRNK